MSYACCSNTISNHNKPSSPGAFESILLACPETGSLVGRVLDAIRHPSSSKRSCDATEEMKQAIYQGLSKKAIRAKWLTLVLDCYNIGVSSVEEAETEADPVRVATKYNRYVETIAFELRKALFQEVGSLMYHDTDGQAIVLRLPTQSGTKRRTCFWKH
jgi:hypothetical protein